MTVQSDHAISITYVLTDDEGVLIEKSGDKPLVYLHGHRNIVPGLEKALAGLKKGDQTTVRVKPSEGYGDYNDKLNITLPLENSGIEDPEVGELLEMKRNDGRAFMARVVEFDEQTLTVDANHPLAGVALNYKVSVQEIREAKPAELASGHIHSSGCGCC